MKKNTGIIVGAIALVVILVGLFAYNNGKKPANAGVLYIGITDATADISDVSDIDLSVKKVEVKSSTGAWVKVASDEKVYKLLSLNASGKTELYAKAYVSAGTYDQIRVSLGDVVVKTKSKGDVKANLPSKQIFIDSNIVVKEKSNTSVKLDILADQSLHTTGKGEYVFASVVKAEARSEADVKVSSDDVVSSGGKVDQDATFGVDLTGKARKDFILKTGKSLEVESSSDGKVKFLLGGEVYEDSNDSDDDKGDDSTKGSSYLEVKDSGEDSEQDKNDDKGGEREDKKGDNSKSSLDLNLNTGVKFIQE